MMPRQLAPLAAVVFDFDGTLAKPVLDFRRMKLALAALAEAFLPGRPEPGTLPLLEWLDELASDVARHGGQDLAREFHTRARFLILTTEIESAREENVFDFTRPLLDRLRRQGLGTAIITRNSGFAVRKAFPDWRTHTGALLAREDVPRVKPDPDHLLRATSLLGAGPERTLLVGDHPIDIRTGRAAGALCAGVGSGGTPIAALRDAGADFTAGNAWELMDVLERSGLL